VHRLVPLFIPFAPSAKNASFAVSLEGVAAFSKGLGKVKMVLGDSEGAPESAALVQAF
jgi:hypothetical protein